MSREPYRRDRYVPPARFHALEREVLAALAWENDHIVSDLAGQVEEALPGHRRNTSQGFRHEIIVDRARPSPKERVTGLFGTVHALIDGLEDAVLFQVELREGRLIALVADSYGQPTAHIDFQTVGYEQVFWIDVNGNSQPFEPDVAPEPGPVWERAELRPLPGQENPPTLAAALAAVEGERRWTGDRLHRAALDAAGLGIFASARPEPAGAPMDRASLKVGLWVTLVSLALIVAVLTRTSLILCIIVAVSLGRFLTRPAALDMIGRWLAERRWRFD